MSDYSSSYGASSSNKNARVMEEMKNQFALANVQQLLQVDLNNYLQVDLPHGQAGPSTWYPIIMVMRMCCKKHMIGPACCLYFLCTTTLCTSCQFFFLVSNHKYFTLSVITFALVPPHYWYVVMSCLLQQKMSEKCFNKCVHYPNNELDSKEQVAVPIDFFKLLQCYVNHYYRSAYPLVLTDLWKRGTLYLRRTLKECKKGQNSSEYSFILLYQ